MWFNFWKEYGIVPLPQSGTEQTDIGHNVQWGAPDPVAADIDAFLFADVDRVQTGRLSAHSMHTGGSDLDLLAVAKKTTEEAFRHRAPANISRANEEDAFHDFRPARAGRAN